MKKQVGLVLIEHVPVEPGGSDKIAYRVDQMRNTIEWAIGQVLDRKDVRELLKRGVEVIIKGTD